MRIGAFQRSPVFDNPGRVIDAIARDGQLINDLGIDVAIYPEAYLQGHSYDGDFIRRRALALDDEAVRSLVGCSSRINATVIVGFFERRGGEVYNSALVLERGSVAGVYSKAFPVEDGCTPGAEFPIWTRKHWSFGIVICNDLNYPEAAEQLTRQGAKLICAPINMALRAKKAERWRVPALENLKAAARRSRCWVISADVSGPALDGWLSYGCTAVVSPDGAVMARSVELAEDVIVFDLPPTPPAQIPEIHKTASRYRSLPLLLNVRTAMLGDLAGTIEIHGRIFSPLAPKACP